MVLEISVVMEFTKLIRNEPDHNFIVGFAGRWVKVTNEVYNIKAKIVKFLTERKLQFHVVSDLVSPLKIVLRGLPKSIAPAKIISELNLLGFDVPKAIQMVSRKDGRKLQLFQLT